MNLFDIFAKVSLDTKEYESGIKGATNSGKKLSDSLSDVSKKSETTNNKIKFLSSQYEEAKKEVERLTNEFNKSAKETGYASNETKELAEELKNAENKASGFKSELDDLQKKAENSGNSFNSLGSKIKSSFSTIGSIATKGIGVVIGAATAAGGALLALESSTEEYRIAQGKLNTAFESAGYGPEVASEAYTRFYEILGDTDTATEASQLLAKLAESEEDVSTYAKIAAGAYGTFGDSLPIEGLIESANETAKVGQVTGVLADALNWAGISEDEFNAKLASCSSESERNKLIMDTLSDTYDSAADSFYNNNKAIVESREVQAELDNSMAKLGDTVAKIKNSIVSEFTPAISNLTDAFSGMLDGTEGADEKFSESISSLIETAIEKIPDFINFGTNIILSIASGISQSIPALIESIPVIFESLSATFQNSLPTIVSIGSQILSSIGNGIITYVPQLVSSLPNVITSILNFLTSQLPSFIQKGTEFIINLTNGLLQQIPSMVAQLPQLITSFVNFITTNLPKIIESGVKILINLVTGIIKSIPELVKSLPKIISAIVEGIGSLMSSIINIGKDIVKGIWQGIQNMAAWIKDKVTGFFSGIVNGVKAFLGISSPSKVFSEVGKNMALGVGLGWEKQYSKIRKSIDNSLLKNRLSFGYSFNQGFDNIRNSNNYGVSDYYGSEIGFFEKSDEINNLRYLISIINILKSIQYDFNNFKIVLDSGVIAGQIAPDIDKRLGRISSNNMRYAL